MGHVMKFKYSYNLGVVYNITRVQKFDSWDTGKQFYLKKLKQPYPN